MGQVSSRTLGGSSNVTERSSRLDTLHEEERAGEEDESGFCLYFYLLFYSFSIGEVADI